MAELLGAGSGVLGVAEVGFSLASTLYKYASSVKGAEKELKAIAKDVELTSKVLKQAHEQLQKDRDGKLCTNEAIDVTSDVLEGCRDAFQEVDNELKRSIKTEAGGKSTLSLTSRLKFPLKSNKMELLRANLEKLKTTLLLMLSVLAYGRKISSTSTAAVEVKAEISLEKLQIQNLVLARDEATKRYEEMSAAFARLESRLVPPQYQQSTSLSGPSSYHVFAQIPSEPPPSAAFTTIASSHPAPPLHPPPQYQAKQAVNASAVRSLQDSPGNTMILSTPSATARIGDSSKPTKPVSEHLGRCASTVKQLAATIEGAIQRWELFQVLEHSHITNSLNETMEAIAYLDPNVTANQDQVTKRIARQGEIITEARPASEKETTAKQEAETDEVALKKVKKEEEKRKMEEEIATTSTTAKAYGLKRAEAEVMKSKEEHEAKLRAAEIAKQKAERTSKPTTDVVGNKTIPPVRFKYGVGRTFSFPFELCKTWDGMEGLIKSALLQVSVVGERVNQRQYNLIGPDGEIILPDVWEALIQPGWEVSMRMWPLSVNESRTQGSKIGRDAAKLVDQQASSGALEATSSRNGSRPEISEHSAAKNRRLLFDRSERADELNESPMAAEESEEEDWQVKQEIRFIKQQDVASTRNARRIAEQAEQTGRETLARLAQQGERIPNAERNLVMASPQNRLAAEKGIELKTLNRSMFAVHVGNPFTAKNRERAARKGTPPLIADVSDPRPQFPDEESYLGSEVPDLEGKNRHRRRQFRDARDGYESDEGEVLRTSNPPAKDRIEPENDDDDQGEEFDVVDDLLRKWTTVAI